MRPPVWFQEVREDLRGEPWHAWPVTLLVVVFTLGMNVLDRLVGRLTRRGKK